MGKTRIPDKDWPRYVLGLKIVDNNAVIEYERITHKPAVMGDEELEDAIVVRIMKGGQVERRPIHVITTLHYPDRVRELEEIFRRILVGIVTDQVARGVWRPGPIDSEGS